MVYVVAGRVRVTSTILSPSIPISTSQDFLLVLSVLIIVNIGGFLAPNVRDHVVVALLAAGHRLTPLRELDLIQPHGAPDAQALEVDAEAWYWCIIDTYLLLV